MRTVIKLAVLSILLIGAVSCGSSGASEADMKAEAEATQLDSATQVIDSAIEELDEKAADLETALDSLDVLFPEEN